MTDTLTEKTKYFNRYRDLITLYEKRLFTKYSIM
jgi:hypothetical protein